MRFETKAIHVGQAPDPSTGAVVTPVHFSSTFAQESPGKHRGYDYSRTANPTRKALEECAASLENARYGLAFASGMAAINDVLNLLKSGDHIVCTDDVYGGTFRILERVYKNYDLECSFVDTTRLDNTVTVEQAEAKRVALPPSLSIEGIRQSISFALLTPAWLPRASSP